MKKNLLKLKKKRFENKLFINPIIFIYKFNLYLRFGLNLVKKF